MAAYARVLIAAGRSARVAVPLKLATDRLLRKHRRLTLSVTAVVFRDFRFRRAQDSFVITAKAPPRRRR